MNKLFGSGPQGNVLVCVLEPGNLHKLVDLRQPIEVDLNDKDGPWVKGLPAKVKVTIAFSATPVQDMRDLVKQYPDMPVQDKRTPVSETKRPHCPECHSTIEQLGVWRSSEAPLWLTFCTICGCVFGVSKPIEGLERKK